MKHLIRLLPAVLLVAFAVFSCKGEMGLGDPVDLTPPVLKMDPTPNPKYVQTGATLTGTVTDNVKDGVDRVILREAGKTREMFKAKRSGDRWELKLNFDKADNGKKITCEVVAYDKAGNSGEPSIAAITLIIDVGEPLITDSWIQRTTVRQADLVSWDKLQTQVGEGVDLNGERIENVDRYQNGWFRIHAQMSEDETRINDETGNVKMKLEIFDPYIDSKGNNEPLLSLVRDDDSSLYAPRWLIKEEAILAEGELRKPGYTAAYNNGERYYYRVDIVAQDMAENGTKWKVEEQDYFCMWIKGDEPKGLLDPKLGSIIVKATPLPVQFFDDDSLDWAYTDLFTKDQWDAIGGATADDKLNTLYNALMGTGTPAIASTYTNWAGKDIAVERLKIFGTAKTIDDTSIAVPTGNGENDYGDYVLFALVGDKKLSPHPASPSALAPSTSKPQWKGRHFPISIIDDSLPVIVFDTVNTKATDPPYDSSKHPGYESDPALALANTGDSPEENTFPVLRDDGESFSINGYILRENTGGYKPGTNIPEDGVDQNGVRYFRMAWIPYGAIDTEDPKKTENALIKAVQEALAKATIVETDFPAGVKHWDFVADDSDKTADNEKLIEGTPQEIGNAPVLKYRKQVFKQEFNILNSFIYNGKLENEIKIFVFCAIDRMSGKEPVFRTIRLLANKTPPALVVYDFTIRNDLDSQLDLPALKDFVGPSGTPSADERAAYELALKGKQKAAYKDVFSNTAKVNPIDKTENPAGDLSPTDSYSVYTRDTTLKYWVATKGGGDLRVKNITMKDVTYSLDDETKRLETGYYDGDDPNATPEPYVGAHVLTYTETLPEVTQRVFLFEATDILDNVARIQRTIAIASTAVLKDITTVEQSGEYGIDKEIVLQANFSGQVKLDNAAKPQLNIRIRHGDAAPYTYTYKKLLCETPANEPVLALKFRHKVGIGAAETGVLETADASWLGVAGNDYEMSVVYPILLNGAKIVDAARNVDVFLPNYGNMANWPDGSVNTLQAKKNIKLDGERPTVSRVTVDGKDFIDNGLYYFKANETINFTLAASKPILPEGTPRLQFRVTPEGGAETGYFEATYQRPEGATGMFFSYAVPTTTTPNNPTNPPNGRITSITLLSDATGKAVDSAGNAIDPHTVTANNLYYVNASSVPTAGAQVRIDRSPPPVTAITINNTALNLTTAPDVLRYNGTNVPVTIPSPATTAAVEPWGTTIQYSLNGGSTWNTYNTNFYLQPGATPPAKHTFKVRYTDRAGNVTESLSYNLEINSNFPKLIAVISSSPNGYYVNRTGTLNFSLGFDDEVRIQTQAQVTITLSDRNDPTSQYHASGTVQSQAITGTAEPDTGYIYSSTLNFSWSLNGNYEMPNGLFISAMNLTGLRDRYNNPGVDPSSAIATDADTANYPNGSITINSNKTGNLAGADLKVDTVLPGTPTTYSPANNGGVITDNQTITFTFREPVQKGMGTITIKPLNATANDYAIPPVFENETYYLNAAETTRYSVPQYNADGVATTTKVEGLYDVYNTSGLTAADKNALTQSTTGANNNTTLDNTNPSMSRQLLKPRTGQSAGPYMRLTHGLKQGAGYTGSYNNNTPAANGPSPEGNDYMIPDTATKWVLDYNYSITQNVAALNEIRRVLDKAHFRWQEFDVTSSVVEIGRMVGTTFTPINGTTITTGDVVQITLPELLNKGLQWELSYDAGTFTDMGGNSAAALPADTWFWSNGVQDPVIRVNRRSYDARAVGTGPTLLAPANDGGVGKTYAAPADTGTWNANTTVTDLNGWGIGNFTSVHYRVETETPGATINYATILGRNVQGTFAARTGGGNVTLTIGSVQTPAIGVDWTANAYRNIPNAGSAANTQQTRYWSSEDVTAGEWVTPNLIRRANGTGATFYNVTEYGVDTRRSFQGNHRGVRSYNKDATFTELSTHPLTGTSALGTIGTIASNASHQLVMIGFNEMEASKNYVIAEATVANRAGATNTSGRGYEGIFRSVVALRMINTGNNAPNTMNNITAVEGSNIKNGMPSIAGFPVRDAEETGDNRFIKLFYRATANNQIYWVSTEIVSQWYFLVWGAGGTHMSSGEANNYLTAGYGDLTFGYNVERY